MEEEIGVKKRVGMRGSVVVRFGWSWVYTLAIVALFIYLSGMGG